VADRLLRKGMRELLKLGDRPLHFPRDKVETTWSQIYWPGENFEASQFRAPVVLFKRPRQPFYYLKDETLDWVSSCLI